MDTFLKPPLYAFAYYKQDIAHFNAVRTSTHCAKLAIYVGVSWHWAGGAERLIQLDETRKPPPRIFYVIVSSSYLSYHMIIFL